MTKPETQLPRCSECGGKVQLLAKPGRTREYRRGVVLPIPDDFETPICTSCGEEFMIPEVSERLDALLEEEFLARQTHELEVCTRVLRLRHGVSQQDIEDACGVTRTYLSHLRAGRKEASEPLMRLIKVFVVSPEAFEYAAEGTPFTKYLAGLFEVAPNRHAYKSAFAPRASYKHDARFAPLPPRQRAS
jgi:transcriptional regulator with XRE-family HTH domain